MTLDNGLESIWTVFLNCSLFKSISRNLEIIRWNNEVERMWKEVIMAKFEILTHQLSKGIGNSFPSKV